VAASDFRLSVVKILTICGSLQEQTMKKGVIGIGIIVCLLFTSSAWSKMGGGDIFFEVPDRGDVTYSHDVHVGELGLRCTDCHYQIYTTAKGVSNVTMVEMQKGGSCGACHDGNKAFDVIANCSRCHDDS